MCRYYLPIYLVIGTQILFLLCESRDCGDPPFEKSFIFYKSKLFPAEIFGKMKVILEKYFPSSYYKMFYKGENYFHQKIKIISLTYRHKSFFL